MMLTYNQLTRVIQLLKQAQNYHYARRRSAVHTEEARIIGYIIKDVIKLRSDRYQQEHGRPIIGDHWRRNRLRY